MNQFKVGDLILYECGRDESSYIMHEDVEFATGVVTDVWGSNSLEGGMIAYFSFGQKVFREGDQLYLTIL